MIIGATIPIVSIINIIPAICIALSIVIVSIYKYSSSINIATSSSNLANGSSFLATGSIKIASSIIKILV